MTLVLVILLALRAVSITSVPAATQKAKRNEASYFKGLLTSFVLCILLYDFILVQFSLA